MLRARFHARRGHRDHRRVRRSGRLDRREHLVPHRDHFGRHRLLVDCHLGGRRGHLVRRRARYGWVGLPVRSGERRVRPDQARHDRQEPADPGASSRDSGGVRLARSVKRAVAACRGVARRDGSALRPDPCPGSRRTGCYRVAGRRCAVARLRARQELPAHPCERRARPVEGRPGREPRYLAGQPVRPVAYQGRRRVGARRRSRWRNHRGRSSARTPPARWSPVRCSRPVPVSTPG